MTLRTIVGSGPSRRPLPMGREAVERAIHMCEFWRAQHPARAGGIAAHARGLDGDVGGLALDWLPVELAYETRAELRERLRGMP